MTSAHHHPLQIKCYRPSVRAALPYVTAKSSPTFVSFFSPAYGASLPIQDCTDGYYCDEGAAAALPCPGGTTKRLNVTMTRKEDCDVCGEGTFCPVGSRTSTNCSAGTFNDKEKQEACIKCTAGTFQDVEGATACKVTGLTPSWCWRGARVCTYCGSQ